MEKKDENSELVNNGAARVAKHRDVRKKAGLIEIRNIWIFEEDKKKVKVLLKELIDKAEPTLKRAQAEEKKNKKILKAE